MIVKVKSPYTDSEFGRGMRMDEIFTVSDERGELLLKKKVVEKIGESEMVDSSKVAEFEKIVAKKDKTIATLTTKIAELESALSAVQK